MSFPKLISVDDDSYTDDPCEPCDGYGFGCDGLSTCRHCGGTGYKPKKVFQPVKSVKAQKAPEGG